MVVDTAGTGVGIQQVRPLKPVRSRKKMALTTSRSAKRIGRPRPWGRWGSSACTYTHCVSFTSLAYLRLLCDTFSFPSASIGHLAMPIVSDGHFQIRSKDESYLVLFYCYDH
jgi:hypothetical protein